MTPILRQILRHLIGHEKFLEMLKRIDLFIQRESAGEFRGLCDINERALKDDDDRMQRDRILKLILAALDDDNLSTIE